ncbi:MAG TPA: helix-turn-helix domain-containing protein, partial [Flavobacteriales bacterium]|nr:helix-turn-helix domain-containing protein [Flavobacteriales bacterium]
MRPGGSAHESSVAVQAEGTDTLMRPDPRVRRTLLKNADAGIAMIDAIAQEKARSAPAAAATWAIAQRALADLELDLPVSAGREFERLHMEFRTKGMELSHFSVLNHLARTGEERTPAQLARAFHVTRGAMTNTLTKLEWA